MASEQAQSLPEIVAVLIVPILVYISGRLVEQGLKALYRRMQGELIFKEQNQGDSSALTIQTNSGSFSTNLLCILKIRPSMCCQGLRMS